MASSSVSFRDLTTLKVGGTVAQYERPPTLEEACSAVRSLDAQGERLLILGGGSNVLAPDEGFSSTVLSVAAHSLVFEARGTSVSAVVDAGVSWDAFVAEAVSRGLWGVENLSAIPGSVGAAPIQNIGAYGVEVAQTIEWVEVFDRTHRTRRTLSRDDLAFGYRTSLLKRENGRYLVLRVSFRLGKEPSPNTSYKDVQAVFGARTPEVGELRDAIMAIRAKKFPNLEEFGTAGSFFLNPVISQSDAEALTAAHPTLPQFPADGGVKVSLAWILDHVVKAKGMRVGGAFVWDAQPLVIATDRTATAADVRSLAALITEKVFSCTEIAIVPEVTFL